MLPWHKRLADLAHRNGLVYLLHSCGNLESIMPDLVDDVGIDARHSYEDEGNSVFDFKQRHGGRVAVSAAWTWTSWPGCPSPNCAPMCAA